MLGRIVQRRDELSVSAELVRTRDSGQIWGEQYQLKVADIFTIQEDMAQENLGRIAAYLKGRNQRCLLRLLLLARPHLARTALMPSLAQGEVR